MKRLLISVCCVLLLVGSLPFVMTTAEPEQTGTEETSTTTGEVTQTTDIADTTATTESTDPTASTETTEQTQPTSAAFVLSEYSRQYDETTGILSVSWNYAEGDGTDVVGVNVGSTPYSITGSHGRFSVDLNGLSAGVHAMQYVLRLPDGSNQVLDVNPLEISGSQALSILMEVEGTTLRAWLTDGDGMPVADYPLQFTLNSTTVNYTTNQNGEITITANAELTAVTCVAPSRTIGLVRYIGTSASWQKSDGTMTTQSDWDDTQSTTSRTRWSATQATVTTGAVQTYATITGAGTTSVEGSNVAVNVTFDEGVVEAFGLDNSDFEEKARLLMTADMYSTLVGDTKATVMMTMGYNPFQITDQHISQLVSGKSKYSRYADIKRVAVTLGLQFVDEEQKTVDIAVAPEGSYTVRMPVPESMLHCPVLAVAIIEQDGLSHLIDVQVKNGYLEFVTNGFTSVAVLGFGDGAVTAGGGVAWQLIVLLVAGLAMLTGAGLLMYFFVWRKPATVPAEATESPEPADSANDDMEVAEEIRPSAAEFMIDQIMHEPAQDLYSQAPAEDDGVDLYSSDDRRPRA